MKTYLIKVFSSVNAKQHFIADLIEANSRSEAESKVLGKKYYFDSEQKRVLGVCRKAEVVREIV